MTLPGYSSINHQAMVLESNDELGRQYKKFKNSPKYDLDSQEVYCVCRKPDRGGELMVGCDGCDEWFHFKCMHINELYKSLIVRYFCKFCQWRGLGNTLWKRKCRVDDCWNGVESKSKFCSKDCGIRYFKSLAENTSSDKIKLIIDTYQFEDFRQLGDKFPELEKVKNFESNINEFPEELRQKLEILSSRIADFKASEDIAKHKINLLLKFKDLVKELNDKLTNEAKTSKKSKKIELCLYSKHLRDIDDSILQRFSTDTIIESYHNEADSDTYCILEKRKCLRHNGWLNLIIEDFQKTIANLEFKLESYKHQQLNLLRDYSVSVYEAAA